MRNSAIFALALSSIAVAQTDQATRIVEQRPPSLYDRLEKNGPGGPAPKRDLTGFWAGPLEPMHYDVPPLTPAGEARFKLNIPDPFSAKSNDPWRTCDPFGFPRSVTNESRGIAFAQVPNQIIILTQYQKVWRAVWMDGRALPKNVGGKGGPDPAWYGYSVGHWEDDYTLVVETTGVDEKSWIDRRGYPHSVDMHVEERYKRVDHNHLELTVTITDPKLYTKPFVIATNKFRWIPDQQQEEQLCVPSEMIDYMKIIGEPADQDQAAGKK